MSCIWAWFMQERQNGTTFSRMLSKYLQRYSKNVTQGFPSSRMIFRILSKINRLMKKKKPHIYMYFI